jgi:16S rRNA processing protein RimM
MDKHPYDPETVVLGLVGRPHGVHGDVWLRPYNPRSGALRGLDAVILDRDGVRTSYRILNLREVPDGAIARLAGVTDRAAAAALGLALVRAPRAALPALEPGEYYVDDVVGCAVADPDGAPLGTVTGTFWNGAQDVMIVVGEAPSTPAAPPPSGAPVDAAAPVAPSEASAAPAAPATPSDAPVEADAPAVARAPEHLIPMLPEYVLSVDVNARRVVVRWEDP